jgi:F-type H+-transporting ATPase subunit b
LIVINPLDKKVGSMEFDKTLFIQAGIYIILFFALRSLFFSPILALLKKREGLTLGRLDASHELRTKIDDLNLKYNSRMKDAREVAEAKRVEILQRVRHDADQKIHDAKSKTEKALWDYQDTLEREAKILRTKFSTLAGDLKKEIIDAITSSRVVRL